MDSGSQLDVGEVLAGQFRIRQKIGEGGMGAMYLAEQLGVERLVAIKVVHSAMASLHPPLLERFKREARALAQLQHPNVVQLYTIGQTERGLPFLAMEYVAGHTLAQELERGPLHVERALDIARQIASALAEVHARDVVHRDLKPANIMLTRSSRGEERVKVLDFGIAKTLDATEKKLTVTGSFFGTPQYVAPEQARSQPVDARTDIYSLGLVLYELLTGRGPFEATAPFELLAQQISVQPTPPSQRRMGLPPSVDAIVLRCLEKLPERRYQNAGELERELERELAPAKDRAQGGARSMELDPLSTSSARTPWPVERSTPRDDDWRDSSPRSAPPGWAPKPPGQASKRARRLPLWSAAWILPVVAMGLFQYLSRHGGTTETAAVQLARRATAAISRNGMSGSDPADPERTYANSAAGSEVMTLMCINFLPDSVLADGASYMRWAGRRPMLPRVKDVGGISRLDGDRMCLESIAAVRRNPSLDAELKRLAEAYASALTSLVPLVNEAASYYDADKYKVDDLEQGRAMHAPLVAAFETYERSERALRAALLERSLAGEPLLVARLREGGLLRDQDRPCGLAVADVRLASRKLVSEGNPVGADLQRIDRTAYAARLDDFRAAVDRMPDACQSREHDYESTSRRLLDHAMKLQRRLASGARYTASERASIERGSALGVNGSPGRLVREAKTAVASLNNTKLMRAAKIAEVAPIERPQ